MPKVIKLVDDAGRVLDHQTVYVNGQPFEVVLEKGPCDWSAFVPSLPGCVATGATEDEVKRVLQETIELHLNALRKDKEDRPWLYENRADRDAP